MRSALLRDFTERIGVVPYRRFGTPIGPISKGQVVQEELLTVKDGTNMLSRNVGKVLPLYAA
jgi:hypothetical protein